MRVICSVVKREKPPSKVPRIRSSICSLLKKNWILFTNFKTVKSFFFSSYSDKKNSVIHTRRSENFGEFICLRMKKYTNNIFPDLKKGTICSYLYIGTKPSSRFLPATLDAKRLYVTFR